MICLKDYKMPETCEDCTLESYCSLWVDARRTSDNKKRATIRHQDCPLIEVPTPHGRLIDADALENEAQMRLLEYNKYDNQFQKPYEVMRAITLAPTIIESEGE